MGSGSSQSGRELIVGSLFSMSRIWDGDKMVANDMGYRDGSSATHAVRHVESIRKLSAEARRLEKRIHILISQ